MADLNAPHKYRLVVFDLGGVLVRICHTWQEVARTTGAVCALDPQGNTPLTAFPEFDLYQAGEVSLGVYLEALVRFTGCAAGDALRMHNGILVEAYPGTEELVTELEAAGIGTGCLSNTNEPHWIDLAMNGRFPAIVRLERKMASHLVGMNKPDPAIFRLYADTHGVRPEEIAYFDDNGPNVAAAREVGFAAFQVDSARDPAAQMRAHLVTLGVLRA
jgi:putative hydrolase of the HAD superfamily